MSGIEEIVEYWIGDAASSPVEAKNRTKLWYMSTPEQDAELESRFGADLKAAEAGHLDDWANSPEGALALIILLDQFSRNLYRGTANAFGNDARALAITLDALEQGFDKNLPIIGTVFLLHPCHHSESLEHHDRCVAGYEKLRENAGPEWHEILDNFLHHALEHRDVIKRFGRFPHRNAVLGRRSTQEEIDYLDSGARRYGQ